MKAAHLLALMLAALLSEHAAFAADLVLEVKSSQSSGRVNVALYDSATSFLRKPVASSGGDLKNGVAILSFPNLAPGNYAISAYLDANGNNKLDTNSMGIPSEPYAFSRSAKGRMGPPTFEDAAFAVGSSRTKLTIELSKGRP